MPFFVLIPAPPYLSLAMDSTPVHKILGVVKRTTCLLYSSSTETTPPYQYRICEFTLKFHGIGANIWDLRNFVSGEGNILQ